MKMTAPGGSSDELLKRMEIMEKQLNRISDYVKQPKPVFHAPPPPPPAQPNPHRQQQIPPKQQSPVIVKNVPTPPKEVKIINNEVEEYEYEEIEVTDDEAEIEIEM